MQKLREYLNQRHPILASQIGALTPADAMRAICFHFGIEERPGDEEVEIGFGVMLNQIIKIDEAKK